MSYNLYTHTRNWGARIKEFDCRGCKMLSVENRWLRVTFAVGKGTDIVEFLYKPLDVDFLWHSPIDAAGFLANSPTISNPSGNFLDCYPGGWQEMLPNAGPPCVYKGAGLGLHGEVCLMPWEYRVEKDEPAEVVVRFFTRTVRTPFYLEKLVRLTQEDAVLGIEEKVRNESGERMDFMWGHHPTFSWPFLDESCRVFVPPCKAFTPEDYPSPDCRLEKGQEAPWPNLKGRNGETVDLSQIPGPETASHDMAFMKDFSDGWYALVNRNLDVGFGLSWDQQIFKCMWYWQVYRGSPGYPWYKSTYVAALEPVSSYPPSLTKAVEAGTQLVLEPGAELKTRLLATAFTGRQQVSFIDPETGKVR